MSLEELSRKNICAFDEKDEFHNPVIEKLGRHVPRSGVQKFVGSTWEKSKNIFECKIDAKIAFSFEKSWWICEQCV